GIYRLHVKSPQGEPTNLFAVQGPHDESDLTPLTEEQWTELERELHLRRIDPNEKPVAASVSSDRNGLDLTPWAITVALLLTGLELGLARHWSKDAF
ncbi:MAG TPA: hypothetical protein VN541_00770, partial [Tepidisphaeraceae bacterium]|nr:hypothetical protein [Tepidisphaeraceae bacterium]